MNPEEGTTTVTELAAMAHVMLRLLGRNNVGVRENVNQLVVLIDFDDGPGGREAEGFLELFGELLQLGLEKGAAAMAMMTSTNSLSLGDFAL
jgi:hypothetical protein